MAATPKPASTLVLMRDRAGGGEGAEVLMVERQRSSAVGPGAYVFPGGILEPQDYSAAAIGLSRAFGPGEAASRLEDAESPEMALGYFLAAIRETFEETLVLLGAADGDDEGEGPGGVSCERLRAVREQVVAGERGFYEWLAGSGWRPAPERLVYFAHWITPEGNPHRFSTRFFLARVPQSAQVVPDPGEIGHYLWVTPGEALERFGAGKIHLMAPTLKNLEFLRPISSTDRALDDLKARPVPTIRPKLRFAEDGGRRVVYPWDSDYMDG